MANAAWKIWKCRCCCVFQGVKPNPIKVIRRIDTLNFMTGKKMKKGKTNNYASLPDTIITWKPTHDFDFYINCDASFKLPTTACGIGLILLNYAGEFTTTRCGYAAGTLSAEEDECEALWWAVKWAKELNIQKLCFIIDAHKVVSGVNEDLNSICWQNHPVLSDIKEVFHSFPSWSL
ncbi:uncharacterized protein LOC113324701 [Papaver somniferum]|uniref:uncharacterized protein LOC113324701 n=1 Tax=Papaver somniferum TaxID=3469 RepID=UPI000E6F5C94|nr:uncharacterized protein LOC113324701 [Papaver somniferum]